MQIPIKLTARGVSDEEEWVMLELQGDLESRSAKDLAGNFIGDLHYSDQGVPILIIGHHILYGKELPLDQPFAVLNKEVTSDRPDKGEAVCDKETSDGEECFPGDVRDSTKETSYVVKAFIRNKLLFKTRPKPIVSNVAKVV